MKAVIAALPGSLLREELARLPETARLLGHKDYEVWLAPAVTIPSILQEIGRLREITFRAAGEGTGESIDLDRFDEHYQHLFVWHRQLQEVVGAYRLGFSEDIYPRFGLDGFYTYQLFDYSPEFVAQLQPCIELGRSFVRPEHQRSFIPLYLLWRGIASTAALYPRYRRLFGPVSISADLPPLFRELLAETLLQHHGLPELAVQVKARNPLAQQHLSPDMLAGIAQAGDLENLLKQTLPDVRMPVLLRQYLNLNGRLLAFSVDPNFNNTLDGLVLVDLDNVEPQTLARYMGDATPAFLNFTGTQHEDVDRSKSRAA